MFYKMVVMLLCAFNVLHSMNNNLMVPRQQDTLPQDKQQPLQRLGALITQTVQIVSPYVRQYCSVMLPLGIAAVGGDSMSNGSFLNATTNQSVVIGDFLVGNGTNIPASSGNTFSIVTGAVFGTVCCCACLISCCGSACKKDTKPVHTLWEPINSYGSAQPVASAATFVSHDSSYNAYHIQNTEDKKQKNESDGGSDLFWVAAVAAARNDHHHHHHNFNYQDDDSDHHHHNDEQEDSPGHDDHHAQDDNSDHDDHHQDDDNNDSSD
jgi:hypothetical protein